MKKFFCFPYQTVSSFAATVGRYLCRVARQRAGGSYLRIVTVFLVSLSAVAAYQRAGVGSGYELPLDRNNPLPLVASVANNVSDQRERESQDARGSANRKFRRARPTLDDVFAASCRVSVEGARGSGLFVCYQGNKAYVLTNYHVVQNNATARLDFWTNHTRQSVTGRVVKRFSDRRANLDFAIIEVNADDLKKIDPPFIPLAPVDPNSLTGRKIYAAGGPKGWFVQSWKGSNESVESGLVLFSPHPVPGQSGSGVCTIIDGEIYAVEVLTYLLGDENSDASKGGALPVLYLANALKGRRQDFGDALDKAKPIPVAFSEPASDQRERSEPDGRFELPLGEDNPRPLDASIANNASDQRERKLQERAEARTGSPASGLSILAFTSADCPACKIGEEGLTSFEETGGLVKRIDPNQPENASYVSAYHLTETPTYFVVNPNGDALARVSFDDIKKQGAVAAVRLAVASATQPAQPKPAKPQQVETPVADPPASKVKLDSDHGVIVSGEGEPRMTLPVYVTNPKEYELDLRQPVYDDGSGTDVAFDLFSDWSGRGKNDDNAEPAPSAPSQDDASERQIGDRLAERLANALSPKIEKAVGTAADAIAKNIQENIANQLSDETTPLGGMKKDVEKKIDAKAKELFKKYAWRVALDLVILMVLAQLATQGVIAGTKWLFSAGVEMRREVARYRDYLENGNNGGKQ